MKMIFYVFSERNNGMDPNILKGEEKKKVLYLDLT